MRYNEFKPALNEQDIHNPNVNMKDVFEMLDILQKTGMGLQWTGNNDGIIILGALGDPKVNKEIRRIYSSFRGADRPSADTNVDVKQSSSSPGAYSNAIGWFMPDTGEVTLKKELLDKLKTTMVEALPHELAHRGFNIIARIPRLRQLVHPDLDRVWKGGWGRFGPDDRFPNVNNLQVTPEHAMLFSTQSSNDEYRWQTYIKGLIRSNSIARDFFNSEEFQNKQFYADVDSDYPLEGRAKIIAYWADLYYTTSRNVSSYLNNMLRSKRPIARDDSTQDRGSSTSRVRIPPKELPTPPTPPSRPAPDTKVSGVSDINDIITGTPLSR